MAGLNNNFDYPRTNSNRGQPRNPTNSYRGSISEQSFVSVVDPYFETYQKQYRLEKKKAAEHNLDFPLPAARSSFSNNTLPVLSSPTQRNVTNDGFPQINQPLQIKGNHQQGSPRGHWEPIPHQSNRPAGQSDHLHTPKVVPAAVKAKAAPPFRQSRRVAPVVNPAKNVKDQDSDRSAQWSSATLAMDDNRTLYQSDQFLKEAGKDEKVRKASFCSRPCCCCCCRCCTNSRGFGICLVATVLLLAATAVSIYLLFPSIPTISVQGIDIGGDVFVGSGVTLFSLASGGGGSAVQDTKNLESTKIRLPLSINLKVQSDFRIGIKFNNIKLTGFAAVNDTHQQSTYVPIGSGSLGSPVTIPPQSTFLLTFPFTMEYDTADPSGASMVALHDLFNSCGLFDPNTKKPITLKYNVALSIPLISWTGFTPTFADSANFNCPWSASEINGKLGNIGNSIPGAKDI